MSGLWAVTSEAWQPASMSAQLPTCSAAVETGPMGLGTLEPSLELGPQAGGRWGMRQARTWALPYGIVGEGGQK